ncbi:MAG: patatin family protein [Lachnospiraceae bacterium]|nr:patatin family protein [Lachnospiraceae bacterium]
MKTGLILEGGAMRGMYTAGILDVFMENDIRFDGAIGVSAGACFGCNLKSRQIGRAIRYNKKYCRDKRYGTYRSLLKTGDVYDADLCYHKIPEELDPFDYEAYRKNPMKFYAVVTDANTGLPVYHLCEDLQGEGMEWIRASASMPVLSKTVKIGDGEYSDGGTADSVPLAYFQSIGYSRNVVILTQPPGYRKGAPGHMGIIRMALRKYPMLLEALRTRPDRYNENIAYVRDEEKKGNVYVIAPSVPVPSQGTEHDPEVLEAAYRMGREDGEKHLEKVRAFLKNQ